MGRGRFFFVGCRTDPNPAAPPSAPGLPPVGRQPQPESQLWEWCAQKQDRCRDAVCLFAPWKGGGRTMDLQTHLTEDCEADPFA